MTRTGSQDMPIPLDRRPGYFETKSETESVFGSALFLLQNDQAFLDVGSVIAPADEADLGSHLLSALVVPVPIGQMASRSELTLGQGPHQPPPGIEKLKGRPAFPRKRRDHGDRNRGGQAMRRVAIEIQPQLSPL